MTKYSLTHLADQTLLSNLATLIRAGRSNTAEVLAHLAEVEKRRLYAPEGHPSMYAYCVGVFHMTEDEACDRIRAARAALRHPILFEAIADGRLNLTCVLLLAAHLTPENARELVAIAGHRRKRDVQSLLAERFPQPDLPTRLDVPPQEGLVMPRSVPERIDASPTTVSVPERIESPSDRARVEPLSPGRIGIQFTIGQQVHDKLRHLEALLGRSVRDFEALLELGLDARIQAFEKRKYAKTDRPRRNRRSSPNRARYIPAEVKRAVRERDGGRCTFEGHDGRRCEARAHLQFDHIEPVARGGLATVGNLRLRCPAHNQYAAEQAFGAEFIRNKRDRARLEAAERRALGSQPPVETCAAGSPEPPRNADDLDVVPWLLRLGFRAGDARRAADHCAQLPAETSLEDRVRAALRFLTPPHRLPKKPHEIAA